MNIKKIVGTGTLLAVLCCSAFYFFSYRGHSRLDHALEDLLRGNYGAAEESLDKVDSSFPIALYKGYLAQLSGHFNDSDLLLQQALKESRNDKMTSEVLLAQAANAYFERRECEISPLLEKARRASLSNEYIPFFEGFVHYMQHNFSEALRHWAAFEPPQESDWNRTVFERLFSPSWLQLHFAHSLAEEGDIISARMVLEREMHLLSCQEEDLHSLGALFLGLTYLKESFQLSSLERNSCYKLAHFYFGQAGRTDRFFQEKKCLITHLKNECKSLFVNGEYTDWAISFTQLLHEWGASPALDEIAEALVPKLLQTENTALCKSIQEKFQGTRFHHVLSEQLMDTISRSLKQHESLNFPLVHANITSLAPTLLSSRLASMISEEIYASINHDADSLSHTCTYLNFWNALENSEERKVELIKKLMTHSEYLWQKEGQEKKGTRLMEIALGLAEERERDRMLKKMDGFLVGLYRQAEKTNMVRRLSLIHDALDYFAIGAKELVSPTLVANHLADAQYLLKTHNYALAMTHAEWILKLDKKNQEALRLLGISAYHLGEYTHALATLKELTNLDDYARKALILSKVFSSQEQERHLAKIDDSDCFNENE
ncbi:MAG: hypothetical protein KR126chlam2_00517 [Chlamydiae bacterium]|nr:hypothetical protein [Chlamydiota bacterium]